MVDNKLANKIVDFLNDARKYDHDAMGFLIQSRVSCNKAMADHPTIQVMDTPAGYGLDLLGILNGLCGVGGNQGSIVAQFDDFTQEFIGFALFEECKNA